jgi:hypothetical protein
VPVRISQWGDAECISDGSGDCAWQVSCSLPHPLQAGDSAPTPLACGVAPGRAATGRQTLALPAPWCFTVKQSVLPGGLPLGARWVEEAHLLHLGSLWVISKKPN